jgi:hypothetical protein
MGRAHSFLLGMLALGTMVPGFAQVPADAASPADAAAVPQTQTPTGASVIITSGPHKGEYVFTEPCVLASFSRRPMGVSVVLHATDSVLSIDMPVADQKHSSEIQIVLVIADGHTSKGPSSVTYEIDTRPDATLEPFQKAERANKGMTGKVTTTITPKGDGAILAFTGQTLSGVKLEGTLTCKKIT